MLAAPAASSPQTLESARLVLRVETNGAMTLRDKLAGGEWRQQLTTQSASIKLTKMVSVSQTELRVEFRAQQQAFTATVALVAAGNEVEVTLAGAALPHPLYFPAPFLPHAEAKLILALKEGLAVPVQDTTVFFDNQKRGWFQFYEGHNAAMPFWGLAERNGSGLMTLILTPNDASFLISRQNGLLTAQVAWEDEFGRVGYPRRLRYVPLERGGYVAMARRYRAQAEREGLVKTLAEKIRENPHVARLLGAADIWFLDFANTIKDSARVAQEIQQAGVRRAIFAGGGGWWTQMTSNEITAVNALGFLANRYDCLQDVMAPANFSRIHNLNPIYRDLQHAWPNDIVLTADGTPLKGWPVVGQDGKTYHCGRLADRARLKYAEELIPRDLAARPYRARFLDTEAATAWSEDHNPRQRVTRTQTRAARMQVLDFISDRSQLVTGSEGLSAYAVAHVHYFEGVGPIEPFRVPPPPAAHPFQTFLADYDWGTNTTQLLDVSHRYLIPLWQLVFHDCVVSYARWNEANNKYAHPLWQTKQTLLCALHGRPPIFMFDAAWWQHPTHREMIADIYRQTGPLAQKVGTARMTDHRWLDAAGDVQQTHFDNGVTVTVNFGHQPFAAPDGTTLGSGSVSVQP
jgi:hypothetical protein